MSGVGKKYDAGKLPLELIPYHSVGPVFWRLRDHPDFCRFTALLGWYQGVTYVPSLARQIKCLPDSGDWIAEVLAVLAHGREKYGELNWRLVNNARTRYTAAALRHLLSHMRGQLTDDETGLRHASHYICNLLFLQHLTVESEG